MAGKAREVAVKSAVAMYTLLGGVGWDVRQKHSRSRSRSLTTCILILEKKTLNIHCELNNKLI